MMSLFTVLHGEGFQESSLVNIDEETVPETAVVEDYDYASDSDLEIEDDGT